MEKMPFLIYNKQLKKPFGFLPEAVWLHVIEQQYNRSCKSYTVAVYIF